jgi:hypothetical protein
LLYESSAHRAIEEFSQIDVAVIAITMKGCAGMEPMKKMPAKKLLRFVDVLSGVVDGRDGCRAQPYPLTSAPGSAVTIIPGSY